MITARIPFAVKLRSGPKGAADGEREHDVLLIIEITGPDDERPFSFAAAKELLVQIAILLTRQEDLDQLARELTGESGQPSTGATTAIQIKLPGAGLTRIK